MALTDRRYLVDCNQFGGEPVGADYILTALALNRIFAIERCPDGRFLVKEMCDECYAGYLTREQLRAMGEEIISMADHEDASR